MPHVTLRGRSTRRRARQLFEAPAVASRWYEAIPLTEVAGTHLPSLRQGRDRLGGTRPHQCPSDQQEGEPEEQERDPHQQTCNHAQRPSIQRVRDPEQQERSASPYPLPLRSPGPFDCRRFDGSAAFLRLRATSACSAQDYQVAITCFRSEPSGPVGVPDTRCTRSPGRKPRWCRAEGRPGGLPTERLRACRTIRGRSWSVPTPG
jgi:hypothetical protein